MFRMFVIYTDLTSDEVDFFSLDALKAAARLAQHKDAIAIFGYNTQTSALVYNWGVDIEA